MVNIIKAEHQKAKRTMRKKKKVYLGISSSYICHGIYICSGMTNAYAESVWNWWYTLLLCRG